MSEDDVKRDAKITIAKVLTNMKLRDSDLKRTNILIEDNNKHTTSHRNSLTKSISGSII